MMLTTQFSSKVDLSGFENELFNFTKQLHNTSHIIHSDSVMFDLSMPFLIKLQVKKNVFSDIMLLISIDHLLSLDTTCTSEYY